MKQLSIPVLDFHQLMGGNKTDQGKFVQDMEEALRTIGFFLLANHDIHYGLVERTFTLLEEFIYRRPWDIQKRYIFKDDNYQWGYTPLGKEAGGGKKGEVGDYKRFWQVHEDHMVDVVEVPGFYEASHSLFFGFRGVYEALMRIVSLSLERPELYYDTRIGNSVLRIIDYPAHPNPLRQEDRVNEEATTGGNIAGMCAGRHTDINMLTLLFASEPGLQLLLNDEWREIVLDDPTQIVVNCGDMLQHLTHGAYKSGWHRVVCSPNTQRWAAPFFGHVRPRISIAPLERFCQGVPNTAEFPYKTAGPFLRDRLSEIGLGVE